MGSGPFRGKTLPTELAPICTCFRFCNFLNPFASSPLEALTAEVILFTSVALVGKGFCWELPAQVTDEGTRGLWQGSDTSAPFPPKPGESSEGRGEGGVRHPLWGLSKEGMDSAISSSQVPVCHLALEDTPERMKKRFNGWLRIWTAKFWRQMIRGQIVWWEKLNPPWYWRLSEWASMYPHYLLTG